MKKTNKITPDGWEQKDRLYILKNDKQPLVMTCPAKHSVRKPLLWFDEETGEQRELRYATNQNSCFVDEQKGTATLGRIVFRNGSLNVPARQKNLQKLLSVYHPLKDKLYYEHDDVQIADNQLDYLDTEVNALVAAKTLTIEEMEAVLRVEVGSRVGNMTSSEIKRDILLMAKRNPAAFLEIIQDDNVHLRNHGIKAVETGVIKLSPDNRKFSWGSNGRKLFTVPLDEHPFSALAAWFKTDEGMEVYKQLEKRLNK